VRSSPQPPGMLLGGCITGGTRAALPALGGGPWPAAASPPPAMFSHRPAAPGGDTGKRQLLPPHRHPGYFGYGSPSFAFAASPPSPPFCRGQITRQPRCQGRGAGGRAAVLPATSCARQHQRAAGIARGSARPPALSPSDPQPSPPRTAPQLNGCKGDRRRERTDKHPCLHAGSSPQPGGLGQPQNPPRRGPLSGLSISSVSARGEGQRRQQKHRLGASR